MTHVFLILSTVKGALGPIELPDTVHLSILPLAAVALAIEPLIGTITVEQVALKVTLVILQELYSSMMVYHEVLAIQQGLGRIFGRNPFVFLQCLC